MGRDAYQYVYMIYTRLCFDYFHSFLLTQLSQYLADVSVM